MLSRLFFFIVLFLSTAVSASAGVNLTVTPIEGGNTLRFGRVTDPARSNKEIRIRVTSDAPDQYQIFQRVITPLVNERGEQLDRDVIQLSALAGSNASGTIHVQGVDTLGFSEQLIYTSSINGSSDSFILIYQIDHEKITKSGQFIGKILYSVRPLGGGSQDDFVLNIFLEASGEFRVELHGSHGLSRARLDSLSDSQDAYLQIHFGENIGPIKIYQELTHLPRNEEFYEVEPKSLMMEVLSETEGGLTGGPTFVEQRPQLIYEGEALEERITVLFSLDAGAKTRQRSGLYRSPVRYTVESQGRQETFQAELEIYVEPVFEVVAEYPPEGMGFKGLLPGKEPQYKEILVKVNTNKGQPYFVSQNVSAGLTNEKGEQIDPKYFTVREELLSKGSGKVEHQEFSPVQPGHTTLFTSDAQGLSSEFMVIYRLTPYQGMESGDYQAAFVFTLGEI